MGWMRAATACLRLLRLSLHLLRGVWIVQMRFPCLDGHQRRTQIQQWARQLLGHAGVELVVQGNPPVHGPVLLVANHISWLDIPLLQATCACRFVAKAQLRHWPLIGTLASACHTLYIQREARRDAMRVVHQLQQSLLVSDVLALFPEGTTSDGETVLPFHANLFQAAISAHAPIQAVALGFEDAASGQHSSAPSYTGTQSLFASVWRTLSADTLRATVTFGPAQQAQGRDRRTWAAALRQEVHDMRQKQPMRSRIPTTATTDQHPGISCNS